MLMVERLRAVWPVAAADGMTSKTVRKGRDRVLAAEPQPDTRGRVGRREPA